MWIYGDSDFVDISIHALRKESDLRQIQEMANTLFQSTLSVRRATPFAMFWPISSLFQSTLSVRRATGCHSHFLTKNIISIHALRKESDLPPLPSRCMPEHFNPRSP